MPKVEFLISFEDYLAYYGQSEITKSSEFTKKLAFLSVTLILMGSIYAIGDSDGAILPTGALAVSVGFVLGVLLVPFWFAVDRGRSTKQRLAHRQMYEFLFVQPRTFTFDENSWSYTYGTATNCGAWSDITSIAERGTLVILRDNCAEYLLLRSAFNSEFYQEFRARIETALGWNIGSFRMDSRSTRLRYARAQLLSRWRRETLRMLSLYFLGAVLFVFIAFLFGHALSISPFPISAVLLALLPISDALVALSKFSSYRSSFMFKDAAISGNSICFRQDHRIWKLSLTWLTGWLETPWEFCLLTTDQLYQFNKKNLTADERVAFRQILEALDQ